MKSFFVLFLTSFLIVFSCPAEEIEKKVDDGMGKNLVRLLLTPSRILEIDEAEGLQENFLVYAVIGERQGMKSDYGVNPWTGDVWDLWECKRVTNPALRKAQTEIKKRYTPEELKQYHKLHLLRPVNVGLDPC